MCGILGIVALSPQDPARILDYADTGLADLQTRGHEWIGVAYSDGDLLRVEKLEGKVSRFFGDQELMAKILRDNPQMFFAQLRYSTQGKSLKVNAQPHYIRNRLGMLALGSNGDVFDYDADRVRLEGLGCKFRSRNDAELQLMHILAHAGDDPNRLYEGIVHLMDNVRASYSTWLASDREVNLFRDPYANRPFYYMIVDGLFIFASEDCALYGILLQRAEEGHHDGTVDICQVLPGEIINVELFGQVTHLQAVVPKPHSASCLFEKIYFGRPDSHLFCRRINGDPLCYRIVIRWEEDQYYFEIQPNGQLEDLASARYRLGKSLARVHPAPFAECIVAVPDSANSMVDGFSDESGLPVRRGLLRNPYIGKTFISPGLENRRKLAAIKYRTLNSLFARYKRVALGDDSTVFGTSMQRIVRMLLTAGVEEVDLRISCPPITAPCRYGIDMSSKGELVAVGRSVEEIGKYLRVSSIGYLPLEVMRECCGDMADEFCYACWNGQYPI